MGNLFRRYWLPALLSEQLPGPDCDPVRLELLSEKCWPLGTPKESWD